MASLNDAVSVSPPKMGRPSLGRCLVRQSKGICAEGYTEKLSAISEKALRHVDGGFLKEHQVEMKRGKRNGFSPNGL